VRDGRHVTATANRIDYRARQRYVIL